MGKELKGKALEVQTEWFENYFGFLLHKPCRKLIKSMEGDFCTHCFPLDFTAYLYLAVGQAAHQHGHLSSSWLALELLNTTTHETLTTSTLLQEQCFLTLFSPSLTSIPQFIQGKRRQK